ncbi:MAG: hypothetical protein HY286_17645 [Planctomycetes bacterium]|nr:hypothetical protein [Planctomycetota bacterium]
MKDDEAFDWKTSESEVRGARGGTASDAARAQRERLNALGAELIELTKNADAEMQRIALLEHLHPLLLASTLEWLEGEGLPLPELYLTACATEAACVSAIADESERRPARPFYDVFIVELADWAARCVRKRVFLDPIVAEARGLSIRERAMASAMAEAAIRLLKNERQIVYLSLKESMSDAEIALRLELPKRDVQRVLRKTAEAAAQNIEKWTRRFEGDSLQQSDGDATQ